MDRQETAMEPELETLSIPDHVAAENVEIVRGILLGVADEAVHTSSLVECRICKDDGLPENDMVSPCRCDGSMKWVHPQCLNTWRHRSPDNLVCCTVCSAQYDFVHHPAFVDYLHRCYSVLSSADELWQALCRFVDRSLFDDDAASCTVRLLAQAGLFVLCMYGGRFFLYVSMRCLYLALEIDALIDALLFPTPMLEQLYW
jgi:hypothetical protein